MKSLAKKIRRVYPWASPQPDWEWGQELKQPLEAIEEKRLRENTPRRRREEDDDDRTP